MGSLVWTEKITPVKSRATLIPYAASGFGRNHEDEEKAKGTFNAGLDAKVMLTSSLNLDLTFRPDFSNVDVDQQMTNVTRYSLLFPERRNFFLENADLFANYGSWLVKPFFSRRIGLYDGDPVPIVAGGRLSGNVTKGLRIGLMDIQTEATDSLSANNYMVAAFQQRVLSRSSVKIFAANRQTTRKLEGDDEADYNRTYGAEFQYVSKDGKWNAYLRGHRAETPDRPDDRSYMSTQVNYQSPDFYTGLLAERTGENYVNDLGFVPKLYNYDAAADTTVRIGHYTINPWFGYLIYTRKSKTINMLEPNTWSVINYRSNGAFLERYTSVNLTIYFKDTRNLFIDASNNEVELPCATELIDDEKPLPTGRYRFTQYSVKYTTDTRKVLNAELSFSYGGFYSGNRTQFGAVVNVRRQPWGKFGVSYMQNNITLPSEHGEARWLLIGPRAEVSLRNNIWWTTFIQYNTQEENLSVNSRLQWRYRPMSDFFVVYSDNYTDSTMKVKNRGVVVKFTYWLNL
ncbi:MAG: hypothetical protein HC859_13895 [Bacteroidia bacterium]|nr:hypothetical protein [Bacteroidia bacterium]